MGRAVDGCSGGSRRRGTAAVVDGYGGGWMRRWMGAAVDGSGGGWKVMDRDAYMDRQWLCGVYSQLEWFSNPQNALSL
jgi:hypothetical protein